MPVIKNGQYGNILLMKEHTGYHKDVLLKNKYYRYDGTHCYVVWSGVWYEIRFITLPSAAYDFYTTGNVVGLTQLDYQLDNLKLPLYWRKGTKELRIAGPFALTYDFRAGRILTLTLDKAGKLTTGTREVVSGEVGNMALMWLQAQAAKKSDSLLP